MNSPVGPSHGRDAVAQRRWLVHLALMLSFAAVLVSSIFLSRKYVGHSGVTDHSIIGGVVFVLVLIHLVQRRRTVWRLLRAMAGAARTSSAQVRLAISDSILILLLFNAMGSGLADLLTGRTIMLSGLPSRLGKWHLDSILVLVVYVVVHAVNRRGRLRTSHVR